MKRVLVIKDWNVVANAIWREFQETGVSREVAEVLIDGLYSKLLKESSISPGNLLAELEMFLCGTNVDLGKKYIPSVLVTLFHTEPKDKGIRRKPVTVLILEVKK